MLSGLTLVVLLLLLWDTSREAILGALANMNIITLLALFVVVWYVFDRS